jgi:hypothetical protein
MTSAAPSAAACSSRSVSVRFAVGLAPLPLASDAHQHSRARLHARAGDQCGNMLVQAHMGGMTGMELFCTRSPLRPLDLSLPQVRLD